MEKKGREVALVGLKGIRGSIVLSISQDGTFSAVFIDIAAGDKTCCTKDINLNKAETSHKNFEAENNTSTGLKYVS